MNNLCVIVSVQFVIYKIPFVLLPKPPFSYLEFDLLGLGVCLPIRLFNHGQQIHRLRSPLHAMTDQIEEDGHQDHFDGVQKRPMGEAQHDIRAGQGRQTTVEAVVVKVADLVDAVV